MSTTLIEEVTGESMALYDAAPTVAPRGAVIVLQEAFGVNGHIESICDRFAAEGYRSVAPHLFHRTGDPIIEYTDVDQAITHMQAVTPDGVAADLDATMAYLQSAGFGPSLQASVGFCMGGTLSFIVAANYAIGAGVTFYGGGIAAGRMGFPPLISLAPQLKTPWLGFFGDLDRGIPVEEVEALREVARDAPVATEIIRYQDAEHGFHCDARPSYNEVASRDAWGKTIRWFAEYVGAKA